ncbi:hypothetical protein V6N13_057458 [Hibiscus sabdariffa]
MHARIQEPLQLANAFGSTLPAIMLPILESSPNSGEFINSGPNSEGPNSMHFINTCRFGSSTIVIPEVVTSPLRGVVNNNRVRIHKQNAVVRFHSERRSNTEKRVSR